MLGQAFSVINTLSSVFFCSVGVLCAYAANQHLTSQVRGAKKLVNSNFKDLKVFLNDTPAVKNFFFIGNEGGRGEV